MESSITLDASQYINGYKDGWIAALETVVKLVNSSQAGHVDWNAVSERLPELVEKFSHEHSSGTVRI